MYVVCILAGKHPQLELTPILCRPLGYLTVLSSFPNISAKLKAQAFLAEMKKMAKKNPHAMPNVISYSIVINAWAKQGHPERASEVLRTMYEDYVSGNETAKPDIKSFNTILAAYIKCKDDNAPIRAENFFNHMMNVRKDGVLHIQPDVYSYSSSMLQSKSVICAFLLAFLILVFILLNSSSVLVKYKGKETGSCCESSRNLRAYEKCF